MNDLGLEIVRRREAARLAHLAELGEEDDPLSPYGGITLGALRRGKNISWTPGAEIDIWTKCARQESATGVPWPHVMFIQTIGGEDGGSIYCPVCREERPWEKRQRTGAPVTKPQLSLF